MPYFDRVQRYCFFIAPARSGHSIVAHLLNAHPDILISDELDALSYFQDGYRASQVYALIRFQDKRAQARKRKKSGYDYSVEGTSQDNLYKHPVVIGDAKGMVTARLLSENGALLQRLRKEVGVPIRVIVQVRHPFDILATSMRRKGLDLGAAIDELKATSDNMETSVDQLAESEVMTLVHEDLISNPKMAFEGLFDFLDVETSAELVGACASKIWAAPHKTRRELGWDRYEEKRLTEYFMKTRFFARYFATKG